MKINRLDVNGRLNAIGIDDAKPVFHFTVEAEENNESIESVCCLVKEKNTQKEVWNSGAILYQRNNYITYDGELLKPKTSYEWILKITSGNHEEIISNPEIFETGFMGTEWIAKWIEPVQESAIQEEELPFLELLIPNPKFWGGETRLKECKRVFKNINIEKNVVQARVYASAHGVYNFYINGQKQSERRLAPENTAYQDMIYYQTYDVTSSLQVGENEISAILGDGWWIGRLGLSGDSCNYGDRLAFIMQMEILYEDGTADVIVTDASFLSQSTWIRYSDLYIGEMQDFTYQSDRLYECIECGDETDCLIAQPHDPIAETEQIACQKLFRTPEGDLVCDFGQVVAGVISVDFKNVKKGQKIVFEHAEVLDKYGNYKNNIIGRNKDQKDVLICGGECQHFEPLFTYHGFRYVKISGAKESQIDSIIAVVLGSKIAPLGHFHCSDGKLNQLHHNIEWSLKSNMFSVPTDCPQREKLGWTGDIQVFTPTGTFLYDLRSFLGNWLKILRAEQCENGEIPVVAPNPPKQEKVQRIMSGGSNSSGVWGDACVLVPLYLYEAYGDTKVLSENFEMMEAWMRYIKENASLKPEGYSAFTEEQKARNPYLWTKQYHFGDWLVPSLRALPDGVQRGTEETAAFVGSAYYAYTTECFSKVCDVLGKKDIAEEYKSLNKRIRDAVRDEFISDDGIVNGSALQGLYVLALQCKIVEGELKQKVIRELVKLIHENGDCLDTGFSSVSYLLDSLYDNGYEELAYKLLFQTKSPSWLYMVENGATTIWENWVAISPDGTTTDSSYNHYAFGCVGDFIYRHIGGIQREEAGYQKLVFAPDFSCGLTSCQCSLDTPFGMTALSWKKDGEKYYISGTVPVGTTATLIVNGIEEALSSGDFSYVV